MSGNYTVVTHEWFDDLDDPIESVVGTYNSLEIAEQQARQFRFWDFDVKILDASGKVVAFYAGD